MPGLIVSWQLLPQGLRLGLGGFQAPWDSSGLSRLDVMSEGLLLFQRQRTAVLYALVYRVAATPAHDASNSRVLQISYTPESREWTHTTYPADSRVGDGNHGCPFPRLLLFLLFSNPQVSLTSGNHSEGADETVA